MEDFSAQEDTAKTKGSVEQQLCSGTVSDKGEEATAPASECFRAEVLEMATSCASVEFSSKNSEMPLGNVKGAPESIETPGPVEDTNRSVRKVDSEGGELDSSPALQERRCQRGVEVTAGSLGNMLSDNLLKQEGVQGTACKFVSGDGVGQEEIRYCHSVENSSPPNMNKSDEAVSGSCPENGELDRTHGYGSPCNHSPDPDMMVNVSVKSDAVLSNTTETELIGLPIEVISSIDLEQMEVHGDSLVNEQMQDKGSSRDTFGLQPKICDKNSQESGKRANRTPKTTEKKRLGRSLLCSDRVLRSKSKDKSKAEVNEEVLNPNTGEEIKRRGRKKNRAFKATDNEFSKIRKKLYYMLNRIRYEKSLIDAYTGEGWKGLSLEKIKPERELQRATSEIVKRKSRIRDLFQHLDSLCTEGRLPEALFDSEGMIDSEDIFCAKCGSKDLTADNDIILCDGACDRGFHQRCLEPPLLKEDIPPGDEGWLCPACDCKVDCMELLNESQGTNLLISDSWEKIFPEVATDRNAEDSNFGLPSDDSEDMDYDPDAPQNDEELQGDDSGSEESGNATLTDEADFKDKNCLGLPSDDSEDDEFDPDAPDLENAEEASSSSDFTSDSEDLTVMLGDVPLEDGGAGSSLVDRQNSQRGGSRRSYKKGSMKEKTIGDELQSLLDEDSGKDATVLSGKRHVERLDYKKLYDEQYANNSSDSSDDGDWTDNVASGKRKRGVKKGFSTQIGNSASVVDMKQKRNEADLTPRRKSNRLNATNSSSPAAPLQKSSSTSRSTGDRAPSSSSRRLGETVTQRLYEAFKENHYPDQSMREKLAEELGITSKQVRKWFENARWSFHHPSARKATVSASDARNKSAVPQTNMKQHMVASEITTKDSTRNGIQTAEPHGSASMPGCTNKDARENKLGRKQTIRKRYNRSNPGKIMERVDDCVSSLDEKKRVHTTVDGSVKISEAQISNRRQTRRKSAA